jgi:hypothetical protein
LPGRLASSNASRYHAAHVDARHIAGFEKEHPAVE